VQVCFVRDLHAAQTQGPSGNQPMRVVPDANPIGIGDRSCFLPQRIGGRVHCFRRDPAPAADKSARL